MDKESKVLLALSILLFFANIWGTDIYILDEAKNATCAKEMYQSGNWIVPTFNGELRTDKPPLHYYFMILGYSIGGVNEASARFFSGLFGVICVLGLYFFTKKELGEKVAFLTSISLLASLQWVVQFHLAVPDPYLICLTSLSLLSFHRGYIYKEDRYLFFCYAGLGLATLAKGPVAIALPGLIMLLFIISKKDFKWKSILALHPFHAVGIVLLLVLPWYVAVHIQTNGAWTQDFFFTHNIERFSGSMEGHGGPFYLTWVFVLAGMLPFSLFLPQAITVAFHQRKEHSLLLFSLIAAVTIIGFFSLSKTKLPSYPEPSFPFIAIVLGYFLSELNKWGEQWKKWQLASSYWLFALIGLTIPVAVAIAMRQEKGFEEEMYLGWFFLPWTVSGIAALYFYHKKKWERSIMAITVGLMMTSLSFLYGAFPVVDKHNPVYQGLPLLEPEKGLAYFQRFNPAFAFYQSEQVPKLNTKAELESFFLQFPEGKVISTLDRIEKLTPPHQWKIIFEQKDLFEKPKTIILSAKTFCTNP